MAFTKATIITWATDADQEGNPMVDEARGLFIYDALTQNPPATDGNAVRLASNITKRVWIDQTWAERYITCIIESAAKANVNVLGTQITDYQIVDIAGP